MTEQEERDILARIEDKLVNRVPDFTLPIIRRVYSSEIVQEIVSVQPMTAPSSLIFYMEYNKKDG